MRLATTDATDRTALRQPHTRRTHFSTIAFDRAYIDLERLRQIFLRRQCALFDGFIQSSLAAYAAYAYCSTAGIAGHILRPIVDCPADSLERRLEQWLAVARFAAG